MSIMRQRSISLVQFYQHGMVSSLTNTHVKGDSRQFSLKHTCDRRQNILLKKTPRLINVRHLTAGIVESPFGPCPPIPNRTLVDYIFKDSEKWLEDPAVTCGVTGRSYSYGMLRMLVNRCAQALLGHCGLKPRDMVGLLLPNIPEFPLVSYGAIEAGLAVTFVNPLYTPDEIKRQFQNAGVKMIITVPILLEVALTVGPQLQDYRSTVCIGGEDDESKNVHGLESLLTAGHESELPGVNPREVCILPYSSGTTGLPKGVMLSQFNLIANLVQGDHPELLNTHTKDGSRHTLLTALPFFHIFGFNVIMNLTMREGGHLISIPRFTPEDYLKALEKYRPTILLVVPSLLLFLASHPQVTLDHLSSVEAVESGGAPLTEGLLLKFRDKIGRDVPILQGYGMTESSPVTIRMPKTTPPSKIGTIGVPYRGTQAKIISLTTGEPLGTHQSGEILVKGPQIMMGYLNNEKATAETLDEDGWLHTGDVGYYDEDRYFYIIDRCKELIKVKGNQVSPTELENLIMEIEDITDVAVVGVPDTLAGEVPRAYVVRKPDSNINEEDIQRLINSKVANYKKLVGGVKFIEMIPRNPSGKVLRHELKLQ